MTAPNAPHFLVWSNQHRMWWRANHAGYTEFIEEAGRYSRAEAKQIVRDATLDGALDVVATDPVTGLQHRRQTEVRVLAPEDVPGENATHAALDALVNGDETAARQALLGLPHAKLADIATDARKLDRLAAAIATEAMLESRRDDA